MKKKLLIITGAGASLEFGMPSVPKIDNLFEEWAKKIAPLAEDPEQNLYTFLKEKYKKYIAQNSHNDRRENSIINFEKMLFLIQNLKALFGDKNHNFYKHFLSPYIELSELPDVNMYGSTNQISWDEEGVLNHLHSKLVDKLLEYLREKCSNLERDHESKLGIMGNFWEVLKDEFDLGFINLNYDNVILTSLPNLCTGFSMETGTFNYSNLYSGNWNFCYHLHGSVHFEMRHNVEGRMHQIYWEPNLEKIFAQNSSGRSNRITSEGINHLNSSIITGLGKTTQILKDPFSSYYSELNKKIYESDAILFIGYGFSDNHLNEAISKFRFDGKKRKVVVIDFADETQDPLRFRQDDWSYNLFGTIPVNGFEMGDGKHECAQFMTYYKENFLLEKSSNSDYPLAIWYNGFIEACKKPAKIISELL